MKTRKPYAARKPPVPSESHADIEDWVRRVMPDGGADFDPPPPLGTTDRSRYVKLTTLEEAQAPEMHTWIEQAGRVPGWK
jgi:hypothetical protein